MNINTNDILTNIKQAIQAGGIVDMSSTEAQTSGRLKDIKIIETGTYEVEFTTATSYTLKKDGTTMQTGTAGTNTVNANIELNTEGTFEAGEKFTLYGKKPAEIIKESATELVVKLPPRNTANVYLGFEKLTNTSGQFLKGYVMTSYNSTVSLSQQPNPMAAYASLPDNASIDAFIRYTGESITILMKNVGCEWLSVGFFDLLVDPLAWSHPLYAGGTVQAYNLTGTKSAYFNAKNEGILLVRNPDGVIKTNAQGGEISVYPTYSLGQYGVGLSTDEDKIAQMDLLLYNGSLFGTSRPLGLFGNLPSLSLGYQNLSSNSVYSSKTKKQIIGWSANNASPADLVLFDLSFGTYQ